MARRAKRTAAIKPELQRIFQSRCGSQYTSFVEREKKIAKAQRRPIRDMPFSVGEYKDAVLHLFDEKYDGVRQCSYCFTMINARTFVPDHAIPISSPWNGSLDLDNILLSCASCNGRKGALSFGFFQKLIAWISNPENCFDSRDTNNVWKRLSEGGGYRSLKGKYGKVREDLDAARGIVRTPKIPAQGRLL